MGLLWGAALMLGAVLLLPPFSVLDNLAPDAVGAESVAARFDVDVVWSLPVSCADLAGCWVPATPDVIYVADDVDPIYLESVVLHELGHALVARAGGDGTDECAAEGIARGLGATVELYDC